MRTRHGKTGAISVSCPFISLHYSAFPLALRNAPRETVDLSCLPSERSRRQCATYPADKKREKERNRASKWANEREREREREKTHRCAACNGRSISSRYRCDLQGVYLRSLQEAVRSRLFRAKRILLAPWNMPISYDHPRLHCRVYQVM